MHFMKDKDLAYQSEIIPFYFSRLCDSYFKSLFGSAGWLLVIPVLSSFVVFGICGCTILCLYYDGAQLLGVSTCSSESTPKELHRSLCTWTELYLFVDDLSMICSLHNGYQSEPVSSSVIAVIAQGAKDEHGATSTSSSTVGSADHGCHGLGYGI